MKRGIIKAKYIFAAIKARLKSDTETSPTARMLSTHQVIMQMNATITITKSLELRQHFLSYFRAAYRTK